ncbi:MAG: hypothetical protein QOE61_1548 [Micromonosporaceae bacterium]|nr:hypothetical protein [Micromonosporaceae bacterium]
MIGIADGSRAWFGGHTTVAANMATGGSMTGNTTGTLSAWIESGVAASGILNTTVSGNSLTLLHTAIARCPRVDYAAAISAGYASGTFRPQPTDISFDGCV